MLHPRKVVSVVTQWHFRTQVGARRNALVASTALADRRREVLDAEEFVAGLTAHRAGEGADPDGGRTGMRHA